MAVAPPKPRDIPLNALRAFEAAARLGGFAPAGAELGVTPGAVAAHIKALEAELGARLFARVPNGVRLTALGQRALPGLTQAFDGLAGAVQALRAEAAPRVVHIATLPSVAQLWLSPRLPELRRAAPDISISITALEAPPNLKRAPYDLCLFYGDERGGWLQPDVIFPVCAPSVAAGLSRVEDLAALPCLADASWAQDWQVWLDRAAPGRAILPRGPVFSLYALAVEEAVNGAGVLMGHEALVARHLAQGTLIAPFEVRVTLPRGLRLWAARQVARGSAVEIVQNWLRAA